jgi:hypothetical protein
LYWATWQLLLLNAYFMAGSRIMMLLATAQTKSEAHIRVARCSAAVRYRLPIGPLCLNRHIFRTKEPTKSLISREHFEVQHKVDILS